MSEKQEHRRRWQLRLQYISAYDAWLLREPPLWRVFSRRKWMKDRPVWRC